VTDIIQRLREDKASLFYTDSVMRSVECKMPDALHLEAAAEIERLRGLLPSKKENQPIFQVVDGPIELEPILNDPSFNPHNYE